MFLYSVNPAPHLESKLDQLLRRFEALLWSSSQICWTELGSRIIEPQQLRGESLVGHVPASGSKYTIVSSTAGEPTVST
jgi:hypothetical protein